MLTEGILFFQKAGPVMYVRPLGPVFVVAVAVDCAMYFSRADDGRAFAQKFAGLMDGGNFRGALHLARTSHGSLANILAEAAERVAAGKNVSSFMEIQSGVALSRLRQRLYYLSVIVTMAPLLGLLGTISGMISAFRVFDIQSGQAAGITSGVGEALIATAMGLCVAIVALAVHAYFTQRVENILTDMELCFSFVEAHADDYAAESKRQETGRSS